MPVFIDYVFNTNLKGLYFLTQLAFEKMKANSQGSIIFIVTRLRDWGEAGPN
jgi:NAD(P)-dependent dehydrogenase (short-subunit alcohol dehydrogenase family)